MPGLIGRKLGMTQLFTEDGKSVGVTVTTTALLANLPLRAAWLMPLMHSSPATVGVGTTTPPGHIQKV